jgi:hypothetical protein
MAYPLQHAAMPANAIRPCEADGRKEMGGFESNFASVSSSHGCLAKFPG